MSRGVMRFVPHTIKHVPEGGYTFEAFCVTSGCDAESGPQEDQDAALDWAMKRTGRTGHDLFRRTGTDHMRVTRAE